MNSMEFTLNNWLAKLKNNLVLPILVSGIVPSLGSHYDFMNRIYKLAEKTCHKLKKRKPSKKIGKNKNSRIDAVASLDDTFLRKR